jgi:S1-C subfamily serine protease
MKLHILVLFAALAAISPPVRAGDGADRAGDLGSRLQAVSVTIRSQGGEGSGVCVNRGGETFILTAGHVIADNRHVEHLLDAEKGATRTVPKFDPLLVTKELLEDGRSIGKLTIEAEVVAYSSAEHGQDLALLHLRKRGLVKDSAAFAPAGDPPGIGTPLSHVGSLLGQQGSNSFTTGVYSQIGRVLFGRVFDQTTCAAFPGSSGGGVFDAQGRYVGMIVRGAGETFNLIVPVRRIREWAGEQNLGFLFDESLGQAGGAAPDLKKVKLELLEPLDEASGARGGETAARAGAEMVAWKTYLRPLEGVK